MLDDETSTSYLGERQDQSLGASLIQRLQSVKLNYRVKGSIEVGEKGERDVIVLTRDMIKRGCELEGILSLSRPLVKVIYIQIYIYPLFGFISPSSHSSLSLVFLSLFSLLICSQFCFASSSFFPPFSPYFNFLTLLHFLPQIFLSSCTANERVQSGPHTSLPYGYAK